MQTNNKKIIFLDAGHGGIDINGKYMTPATNGKYFNFKDFTFYEGYWNRIYAEDLIRRHSDKFHFIPLYHPTLDTSLENRVTIANDLIDKLNIKIEDCLFLSMHSNAANSKAKGWSIFTSKGITKSDKAAECIINEMEKTLPTKYNIKIRKYLKTELNKDYEENFYVLKNTKMPAVLIENLFFDNEEDVKIIINSEYIKDHNDEVINGILKYFS